MNGSYIMFSLRLFLLFSIIAIQRPYGVLSQQQSSTIQCPNSRTPPLLLVGKRFYNSQTLEYVPIKGIAYYPRPNAGELSLSNSVDFYTDEFESRWIEDIVYFQQLGVNAIRIYGVDPSQNHDKFMCSLADAGIYVMIGLLADCDGCSIGSGDDNDKPPACYTTSVKLRGQFIIRTFSVYDNVIAFSAGNEVTLYTKDDMSNAPCQKKFVQDMRIYTHSCYTSSMLARQIPIGVVNFDKPISINQTLYYACQQSEEGYDSIEWFGLNTYRHCDSTATQIEDLTGYIQLLEMFQQHNLNIPVMLAEFGCRERGFPTIDGYETQREWLQIDALYSQLYQQELVGGFVFEYSAEKKIIEDGGFTEEPWPYYGFVKINYGIGYFSPVNCDHQDISCTYNTYPEFDLLADKFQSIDTSFVSSLNSNPVLQTTTDGKIPDCPKEYPPINDFVWPTDNDNEELLECMAMIQSPTTSPIEVTSSPVGIEPTTTPPTDTNSNLPPQNNNNDQDLSSICVDHMNCMTQINALNDIGVDECCPTTDNVYLDCCSTVDIWCFDQNSGDVLLCEEPMTTSQYIQEVQTGAREVINDDTQSSAPILSKSKYYLIVVFFGVAIETIH